MLLTITKSPGDPLELFFFGACKKEQRPELEEINAGVLLGVPLVLATVL
jgi:hypothetical protein